MKKLIILINCVLVIFLFGCKKDEERYYVAGSHFTINQYGASDYHIVVEFDCDVDVVEIGIICSVYTKSGFYESYSSEYETNTRNQLHIIDTNIEGSNVDSVYFEFYGYSNKEVENSVYKEIEKETYYNVSYYYENNFLNSERVLKGNTASSYTPPKKEGYKFIGWYKDKNYITAFDASSPISSNLVLYAYYMIDYEYVVNSISLDYIKSTIRVTYEVSNYSQASISNGSGVIYKEDDNYYYALTNNHVLTSSITSNIKSKSLSVESYNSQTYECELINENLFISDVNYDLGVIKFKKDENNPLKVIEMEENNPDEIQSVISIGTPKSQRNCITIGNVINYTSVSSANPSVSNINFKVIKHSATIDSGSSGGALLNNEFKLVGINYGSTADYYFAVPIEKVKEFLTNNSLL